MNSTETFLWHDRKRSIFGLPLTFTKYRLTEEKLIIITGFFTTREEEVRLYRILAVSLKRTFEEKLFGLGTLHLCSADKSTPEVSIARIKKAREVRDLLSHKVEEARTNKGVIGREFLGGGMDTDHDMNSDAYDNL